MLYLISEVNDDDWAGKSSNILMLPLEFWKIVKEYWFRFVCSSYCTFYYFVTILKLLLNWYTLLHFKLGSFLSITKYLECLHCLKRYAKKFYKLCSMWEWISSFKICYTSSVIMNLIRITIGHPYKDFYRIYNTQQ